MFSPRRVVLLPLFGLVALLGATPAQADPTSGVFTNTGYYKLSSTDVNITVVGVVDVSCADATIVTNQVLAGATTASAVGQLFGGSHVIFNTCKTAGSDTVLGSPKGTWLVTGKARTAVGPPETWTMSATIGGSTLSVVKTNCVVTIDVPVAVSGSFTDADPPAVPNTTLTITKAALAFTANANCPKVGSVAGTISATLHITANTKQDFTGTAVAVDLS
jgi:hypothetical protein